MITLIIVTSIALKLKQDNNVIIIMPWSSYV